MVRVAAMAIIITTFLLVAGNGKSEEDMVSRSPETSLWCVSNCGTCPVVCSPPQPLPPPPPPPLNEPVNLVPSPPEKKPPSPRQPPLNEPVNLVPSPPEKKLPPPPTPSTSWSFSSSPYSSSTSPASGQDRGGFSYPYYYFYSSDALRAHGFLQGSLWSVSLLLVLLSIV